MQQGKTPEPERVATALAARACGASLREAGKLADVSQVSVKRYEDGDRPQATAGVSPALVTDKTAELLEGANTASLVALDELLKDDAAAIRGATTMQKATIGGIYIDKGNAIRAMLASDRREQAQLVINAAKLPAEARNVILAAMGRVYDAEELKALEPGE
jgi:hypothetical protein